MTYSGFKNYATWNVATWLSNDQRLYNLVRSTEGSYKDLASILLEEFKMIVTPDMESLHGADLDYIALNQVLNDLRED